MARSKRLDLLGRVLAWLWKETRAQDIVEYALILMMVSLGTVAAIPELACAIQGAFCNAADAIGDATKNGPGNG